MNDEGELSLADKIISETTPSTVGGQNENNGTTQYLDDGVTVSNTVNSASYSSNYFAVSAPVVEPSIKAYLAKPYEVAAGVFATTDGVGTFPLYHFPRELLKQTMYHRKIQGFMGFRGTLVLKLQVNAERFQQGRYMVVAVPTGGAHYNNKLTHWFDIHAQSRVQRSQLPHAEIDIATETSCELRLPFAMAQDFYSIQLMNTTPYETCYLVQIFPYSPLATGTGSVNAKYTLWAHYEDVELIGQALPVELQSGVKATSMKRRPTEIEADSVGVGPVQSIAMKVSKASSYLAPIPMLAQFATPLKWAADLTAGVASVFGWSSPSNLEPQHRQKIGSAAYSNNVNKVDMGFPLSLDVNNAVEVSPELSIVKEDELDIAYLANKPSWVETLFWGTDRAEDALIQKYDVGMYPMGTAESFTTGGQTFHNLSPAQYLATNFAAYRSSIIFKFKFVKTEFHSGRLSFDFNPVPKGYTSAAITDDVAPYVYRDIVDIREVNEYVLEIPYMSNSPYLRTDSGSESLFGRLDIRVIDPLVAPTSVSQNIGIIVEHCLGKDAEFAILNKKLSCPINLVELQSGFNSVVGGASTHIAQNVTASIAMGEKITNLRTLLKRFYGLPNVYYNDIIGDGATTTVAPFCNSSTRILSDEYSITGYNDLYGDLMMMFTFSRGGVRFKFTDAQDGANSLVCYMFHAGVPYSIGNVWETSTSPSPNVWSPEEYSLNSINYVIERNDNNSWTEVAVPQYSKTHSRPNSVYWTSPSAPMDDDDTGLQNKMFLAVHKWQPYKTTDNPNTPSTKIIVLRAAAEDTNFSFFISVPPMILNGLGTWS